MAKTVKIINVIDVEATCWKPGDKPKDEEMDIIEVGICEVRRISPDDIGACKFDIWTPGTASMIIVTPTTSKINDYSLSINGLSQEEIDESGISFIKAIYHLKDTYYTLNRTFASWGDYDRKQFERQCKRENIFYPFSITHLNVKNLFALSTGIVKEVSVSKALAMLGMQFDGKPHRGMDDAINIARILCWVLNRG